jgi:hypothetical protein
MCPSPAHRFWPALVWPSDWKKPGQMCVPLLRIAIGLLLFGLAIGKSQAKCVPLKRSTIHAGVVNNTNNKHKKRKQVVSCTAMCMCKVILKKQLLINTTHVPVIESKFCKG